MPSTTCSELIAKNIDSNRQLAAAESALAEELAVSELREQFTAVLGHDLRTPVRAINCFSELLLRTPLTDNAAAMTRLMRDSGQRMQVLIDNLLDLARGRLSGGLGLSRDADKSLGPVLREVIAELLAGQPDRIVETDFAIAEPVNCDRSRIPQLFSNLVSNTLTYGSVDQPVRVKGFSDAQYFELSIANAGEPIPAAALARLFQPFYRSAALQNREGLRLGFILHMRLPRRMAGR